MSRLRRLTPVFACAVCISVSTAWAAGGDSQDSATAGQSLDIEQLKRQLEQQQKEIEKLRTMLETQQKLFWNNARRYFKQT